MKNWQNWLDAIRIEFRDNKDNFLRQPNIARTTHPRHGGMTTFMSLSDSKYLNNTKDPAIGNPDIQFSGRWSWTAVQSAFYLQKMEDVFGVTPETLDEMVDVGAGYGHLCYSFYKSGFKGKYTMIDFPIMGEIQEHFVSSTIGKNKNFWPERLLPKNLKPQTDNAMIFGSFSINEMPLADRQIIEPFYKDYKYIMIVHKNNDAFGVDNKKYFGELRSKLAKTHDMKWYSDPLRKNDNYLLGVRK